MTHLSTAENPWGKPFTNKRYVHPPYAENIITMWPTSMVLIGEITAKNPQEFRKVGPFDRGFAAALPSAGVVFTLKRESDYLHRQMFDKYRWNGELMPIKGTKYKTRRDGVAIHSLSKDMDAVKFHQEVFCDTLRVSTAYIKVSVENGFGIEQKVELGALVRTGPESLFTGCSDPDGYYGYNPLRSYWENEEMLRYEKKEGFLTDGTYRLYFDEKENFSFGGENDLNITLELKPYEKRTFTFAFTRNENEPLNYNAARRNTEAFWKKELGKAKFVPDKKGVEPLFFNFLTQLLQMFACPRGENYAIMRQGATQRYHWPEAKEIIKAFSHIGGYDDYIEAALSHYFNDMQEKDGENKGRIHYEYVPWNSRSAAALEMFAYAVKSNGDFYDKYIAQAMEAFYWMERERAKSADIEGAVKGLFPPGIATDHDFNGAQQWTFADTAMLRGYKSLLEVLKESDSAYASEIKAAYDDYFGVMKGIFDKFAEEQKDSEFLYLPRDPKNNPELEARLDKDAFGYMFPNEALALGLGGYGTETSEKVIYTYSHGRQAENGLIYPMYRSKTGTGRTWYTTWAEHVRYAYYKESGNREKCRELIDALLKYNVTTEYYQCERYDDHDAYSGPWMPNASANGRVLDMLFDYYGKRKIEE